MAKSHSAGSVVPASLQVTFNLQMEQLSTESARHTPCHSTQLAIYLISSTL